MTPLAASGYWLGRLLFTRALGVIFAIAFMNALLQFRALLGEHGLTPIPAFAGSTGFRHAPSIFQWRYSDRFFAGCACVGLLLSVMTVAGVTESLPIGAWMAVWAVIWVIYLSMVNVGQRWYSFGWESLLLEAGFLAIFVGPASVRPTGLSLILLRWLLFRVEFGAGLIKLRGDACWRNLTCLNYHHETQPMPNPLSWWFHHLPPALHRVEVLANHATQLVVIFLIFAPQPVASIAAAIIVVTQAYLMLSGNFAWLNALTLTLALPVFSGGAIHRVLRITPGASHQAPVWFEVIVVAAAAVIVWLSWWPARNLLARRQRMNASFNQLHLVNTYGAFGSVTRERYEVVLQGTADADPGPDAVWLDYEFKGKPGDPRRRPPQVAPYHLRLDWLMWFAALSPRYADGWFVQLVDKLLDNDPRIVRLLRVNPFGDAPPAYL
ncbi:MAG TPA: lipase maturation factor family protein, partial [Thermoleophilia bacterium]|nr:lipase maturation factor family protein [Thermoleophilia bacterium]